MNARSSLWAVILVASVVACGGGGKSSDTPPPKAKPIPKDTPPGLDLRLSNGKAGAPAYDHAQLAPATKLADAEVTQLLSRAKPLVPDPADQSAFAIRPSSAPPPRTGQVITATFPPPPSLSAPPVPRPKDELAWRAQMTKGRRDEPAPFVVLSCLLGPPPATDLVRLRVVPL